MSPLRRDVLIGSGVVVLGMGGFVASEWSEPGTRADFILATAILGFLLAAMAAVGVWARKKLRADRALEAERLRAEAEARERERLIEGEVPQSIEEAIALIRRVVPEEQLRAFARLPLEKAVLDQHFGLGMWIRNKWLWQETPLRRAMNPELDRHPDALSGEVLRALHRTMQAAATDAAG